MIHGHGLGFARCSIWNRIVGFGVRCLQMGSIVSAFFRFGSIFGERHWDGHLGTVLDCIAGVYHLLHV